jgi:hypothetical protein
MDGKICGVLPLCTYNISAKIPQRLGNSISQSMGDIRAYDIKTEGLIGIENINY